MSNNDDRSDLSSAVCGEEGRSIRGGMEVFLFLLVVAMFPFSEDPAGDVKYVLCSWASLLLLAAWMISAWRHGGGIKVDTAGVFRRPQIFIEILVLFLFLGLLASLRGSFIRNSLWEMGRFWSFFVLYFVASQVYRTPQQVRRLMLVVCIAVSLASIYALFVQRLGIDSFPWRERTSDEYLNLPATFGNPNFAAHTLILAIIMAVYLATRLNMIWCLGFAALFLVHLHFTQQRAGVIALAAALLLILVAVVVYRRVRRRHQDRYRRPVAATVTTLAVVAVLGIAGVGLIMGVSKIRHGSPYPLDLSLLIRYKSYCSAASMIMTRPILGYGPANYKIEYPLFWTPYEQKWFAQELKMNAHVHNDPLEIAADAGLPAAGLYLALLVLGMSYGLLMGFTREDAQTRRLGFTYAAFFCAFLVDGLFGFNLRVPVSATLLFVMAGSMEGVWEASGAPSKRAPHRLYPWIWKAAVLGISAVCVVQESAVFVSEILYLRGAAEIEAKRYNRAEPYLSIGERLAPWNWNFARQRGIAQLCLNNYHEAIQHFERARTRNPQYIMTLVPLARAKTGLVMANASAHPEVVETALPALDEAAQDAAVALKLCPMFPGAEEAMGWIASARAMILGKSKVSDRAEQADKAWREAEKYFARAVEHGAKNPSDIYRQLVQVRTALGDNRGAEEAIVRATQADPTDELNWPFFYSFARNAKLYDRFREALLWRIERLQEKKPRDNDTLATTYIWLASVEYDGYKRAEAAETAYRNAISCKPLSPATWSAYAQFAQTANRSEAFKKYLLETNDQILAKGQQPLPHIQALARAWREGPGALVEATALLVGVVQGTVQFPGMMLPDYDMKWAIVALGQEARSSQLPPDQAALVFLHLGIAAGAISEWALADQVLATAMPYLPPARQVDCAQHWANALIRLNRTNEAVNLLKDVVSRIPDDADLRLSLARAQAKNNNRPEAEKEYRALLELPNLSEQRRQQVRGELEGFLRRSVRTRGGSA